MYLIKPEEGKKQPMNEKTANILIVDDDDTMRLTLGDILSLEGYQVHLAANGEIAC